MRVNRVGLLLPRGNPRAKMAPLEIERRSVQSFGRA